MRHVPAARELVLKIVYCGPGMAGKSTNLEEVRRRLPADRVSELVAVDQHSERSVRFDWRADELGPVHGCALRIDIHTIPGQSYYAATRRQLLVGVDGIVFVADSRREALDENIEAMNELFGNLRQLEIPADLPIVLQFNKQDLPTAVPLEQLAPLMNPRNWPFFGAVASEGRGVAETLDAVLAPVRQRVLEEGLPMPTPVPEANLWLLTCWRCQNMVDSTVGRVGAVVPCSVCRSLMEIVDADHGQTQAPSSSETIAEMIEVARPSTSPGASSTQSRQPPTEPEEAFTVVGYTLVKELDRSPLGTRHRIRETATGQTFRALSLSPPLLANAAYRNDLDAFVRLAAPLRHANLLSVISYHPGDQRVVLVSEDPPTHQPLSRILTRRPVIAPPQALGLVRQIAMVLDEVARRGVVHGWLRPEVILIDEVGGVLVDEMAIPIPPRLLVNESFGESAATEYFLAPEYLHEGARPDVQSDMFLLGALLFRMVTGQGMVTGYNAHEALHRVTANGVRTLRDAQPGISRELDGLHQLLVAVDPRDRFKSWNDVLEALDRFGGGAKRQDLQLTRQIPRPGTSRRPGPTTVVHRRVAPEIVTTTSGRRRVIDEPGNNRSGGAISGRRAARRPSRPSWVLILGVAAALLAAVAGLVAVLANRPSRAPEPVATPSPIPRPVTAAPASPPAPPARPTPVPDNVPVPGPKPIPASTNPGDARVSIVRRELMSQVADLKMAERYRDALVLAASFPEGQDQIEQRQQIEALHQQRRAEIEALLTQGVPTPQIAEALHPARGTWGMPGDEEWVSTVMAKATTRHLAPEAPPVVPQAVVPESPPPLPEVAVPAPAPALPSAVVAPGEAELPPVVVDPAVLAEMQMVQALLVGNLRAAEAIPGSLPPGSPAIGALHRMADLWRGRLSTISRVLAARSATLRIPHPTTGEQWDVISVLADRVVITSPSGSGSELAWNQVIPRVQAKLWSDAAAAPGAGAIDHSAAMVLHLLADDNAAAGLHLKRGRPLMVPELVADLERLLDLNQRRVAATVLNRGLEAVKAGNLKAGNETLNDLRRLDRTLLGGREDIVTSLERMIGARTAPPAIKLGDYVVPKDLRERQAALRSAGWEPTGAAYLEGPAVVIPPGAGISALIPPMSYGFSVGLSGSGFLRIIPARSSTALGQGLNLPVPRDTAFISIRLTREGISVVDAAGRVVDQIRTSPTPTHLILRASAEIRLATVPQPIVP